MAKSVSHAVSPRETNISPRDLRPSGLILVSRCDTACDTDFAMYYSIFITSLTNKNWPQGYSQLC